MMIYSEPAITPENLNRLGHQLAKLFRQVNMILFTIIDIIEYNIDKSFNI